MAALLAASIACAASQNASAQQRANPAFNWTGFYIGGNVGYGWGKTTNSDSTLPNPTAFNLQTFTIDLDSHGWLGGLQAGYNWQVNRAVFGLEADFSFAGIRGEGTFGPLSSLIAPSVTFPGSFQTDNQRMDWFSTVRGRAGMLATDAVLVYVTGGLAIGHVHYSNHLLFPSSGLEFAGSSTKTKTGWTMGGGVEWAAWGNWSLKAEYLYYDLGTETLFGDRVSLPPVLPDPNKIVSEFKTRGNIARLGINYKFR